MTGSRGLVALALIATAAPAAAQKQEPAPQGVTLLVAVKPERGFVDDAFAFDGSGGRLAIVRADAGTFAEIELIDLGQRGASLVRFDVTADTTEVSSLAFTRDGDLFVIARSADSGTATGLLYSPAGKRLRKFGPASDVALAEVDGDEVVSLLTTKPQKAGITWEVSVLGVSDGKPRGKKRVLQAREDGFVQSLAARILYWRGGYVQAVTQKKGEYDRFQDQRQPDTVAVWDVRDGAFVKNAVISDVVGHAAVMKLRDEHPGEAEFVLVAPDLGGLELVTADDRRVRIGTAESFGHYDPKTLHYRAGRDGKVYFTLTIDPVNADAVARKKADPELIDLYVFDPAGTKPCADRLARLPRAGLPFSWQVGGGRWAVLRKHKGFDRGGATLEIYDLAK